MTLDGSALKRLAAVQQSQGHVTLADIGSVLPVDSMTPEEIGETMAQLEAAGIDIEVDKEFLRHRRASGLADARPSSHSRFGVPALLVVPGGQPGSVHAHAEGALAGARRQFLPQRGPGVPDRAVLEGVG